MTAELTLDEMLGRLDVLLGRLADGRGPLDELVADHVEATRLLEQAEARLGELRSRLEPQPAR